MKKIVISLVLIVIFSINGRSQWTIQNSPTTENLFGVYFVSATTGVAVGDNGTMIRTTDGGSNWSLLSIVTSKRLKSVYFPSSTIGYAVGNDGVMLKTSDGGQNWSLLTSVTTEKLESVWFFDDNTGFVGGYNAAIYKTVDGGSTWILSNNGTQSNQNILDMHWISASIGYAAITQGGVHGVLITNDGGANWVKSIVSHSFVTCIHFTDAMNGHAAGSWSHIWSTDDGAQTWTTIDSISGIYSIEYTAMYFPTSSTGYIVAWGGNIMKTTNGGVSYTKLDTITTNDLMDIHFPDATVGYVVGYGGFIMKKGGGIGIEENLVDNQSVIEIFPNPFNDKTVISIQTSDHYNSLTLKCYNINGDKVQIGYSVAENRIELYRGDLSKGSYIVEIYNNDIKIGAKRFLIQ